MLRRIFTASRNNPKAINGPKVSPAQSQRGRGQNASPDKSTQGAFSSELDFSLKVSIPIALRQSQLTAENPVYFCDTPIKHARKTDTVQDILYVTFPGAIIRWAAV
jgi:hypothetical protein